MAVINADEKTIGVVATGECLAELRGVYVVARLGAWMDVAPADQPVRDIAIAEKETAAFLRRGAAGMVDDLVPQLPREDEPSAVDQ